MERCDVARKETVHESIFDVDNMPKDMASVVRHKDGAGDHCLHHIGEGSVCPFCNGNLKGCAGANGFQVYPAMLMQFVALF